MGVSPEGCFRWWATMSLSLAELELVVADLRGRLVGQRVRRAYELGPVSVALDLGRAGYLILSVEPGLSRLQLSPKIRKPGRCPSFCGLVRKYLNGAVVTEVSLPRLDRVVRLDFHRGLHLVIELLGHSGQIFLVDADNRILGVHGAARRLAVGEGYVAPELARRDPGTVRFSGEDINEQVRLFYEAKEEARRLEARQRDLGRVVRRAVKKLKRLIERCDEDIEQSGDPDVLRRYGDLLLAGIGGIPPKAAWAYVPDWFAEGNRIRIPLDPALSAAQNANRYYKRAGRASRTRQFATERKATAQEHKKALEVGLSRIEGCQRLDRLEDVARELGVDSSVERREKRPGARPERSPFRRFVSRTGLSILVGKTAQDNHELTFRVARGNDLWLHVSAGAGPHVVVRSRPDGSVDQSSLQDAASLALFFATKNRLASGEVLYTRCKHVRAVKGQVGKVIPGQTKTFFVRLEESSLTRLLSEKG